MKNQSKKLWSVKFTVMGTLSVNNYQHLWILADDLELAARKAKKFLKEDGGRTIVIEAVEASGTIDVF